MVANVHQLINIHHESKVMMYSFLFNFKIDVLKTLTTVSRTNSTFKGSLWGLAKDADNACVSSKLLAFSQFHNARCWRYEDNDTHVCPQESTRFLLTVCQQSGCANKS